MHGRPSFEEVARETLKGRPELQRKISPDKDLGMRPAGGGFGVMLKGGILKRETRSVCNFMAIDVCMFEFYSGYTTKCCRTGTE